VEDIPTDLMNWSSHVSGSESFVIFWCSQKGKDKVYLFKPSLVLSYEVGALLIQVQIMSVEEKYLTEVRLKKRDLVEQKEDLQILTMATVIFHCPRMCGKKTDER
jgi:hypothetical protein